MVSRLTTLGTKKLVSWPNGSWVAVIASAIGWVVRRPARTGASLLSSVEALLMPGVGTVAYGGLECGWSQFLEWNAPWEQYLKGFRCLEVDQGGPLLL